MRLHRLEEIRGTQSSRGLHPPAPIAQRPAPVTSLRDLARWAVRVRLPDVPVRVREQAIDQILSTLGAVYAGWESELGPRIARAFQSPGRGAARVLPMGESAPPSHAAMLMASWSMVLDFDDVMLGGHTGHSSVLVPLALAQGRSGAELLLAQIVANEIAARVNMVCAAGSTRGQMATHLHLIAAAAAKAKLERLDEDAFTSALAFALSYPAQALYPSFLGSDAKALCAAWPVRMGMEAVDAVRCGLAAREDFLDDPRGFFASRTRFPVREFLGGLGERWHTETTSFKIYPVCGYLCSTLDATLDLVRTHGIAADDVEAVDVHASLFTIGMDAHSAPYLDGPRSRISTLTFSTPFTVASAIVHGAFAPAQLKRPALEDPRVWQLARRVATHHDVELTLRALTADIPIGAALRRVRKLAAAAFGWTAAGTALGSSGRWRRPAETLRLVAGLTRAAGERTPLDFARATKPIGARVVIRLRSGRAVDRTVDIPRGFAGAHDDGRSLMRAKFLDAAATAVGAEQAATAAGLVENLADLKPAGVEMLLDLLCAAVASR